MKKQCTEWERIFANPMSNEESISKIHREFTQLNHKETKKSIKIWAGNLNRHFFFFQRRHRDDQQANKNLKNENILSITNLQGNANQNQSETSLETCQNGYHPKKRNNQWWQRCGERGTLVPYWQEC